MAIFEFDLTMTLEKPKRVIDALKLVVNGSPDFEALMDSIDASIINGDDDSCDEAGAWLILEEYTLANEASAGGGN